MDIPTSSLTESFNHFNHLSSDLTELILSSLSIRSIVRAAAVCKSWRSIITSSFFSARISAIKRPPWFVIYGQNNIFLKSSQAFAFDPEANEWIILPTATLLSRDLFAACNGFVFANTSENFIFKPILGGSWQSTCPFKFSRCNPLVGICNDNSEVPIFIVVGGVRLIGGLVDIEDRLAVEMYDPQGKSWELCPPLPPDFRSGNSSQWLCSALSRDKFYVFGIYSSFVSSFDLEKRVWSNVQTLRPPGVLFSFLISCENRLVLAGLCNAPRGPSLNLWNIDDKTMEFSEITIMPRDLLYCLFDTEEDDKFASLKCIGLGNLIYVFNEEHHQNYPACFCEINGDSSKCKWRRVPGLPVPVNEFHKIISFCSTVSLANVLVREL